MAQKNITPLVFFRASLILAVLFTSILVLLSLTALQRAGDLKVVPQIFSTTEDSAVLHKFSQLNTIVPMEAADQGKINEMLARYYLSMRYEQVPDSREMAYRWGYGGPLYLLSTPSVYNAFADDLGKKIGSLPNVITIVEIMDIKPLNNSFEVNFRIHETHPGGQHHIKEKKATLEFRYIKARQRNLPVFTNPKGLVFTRFDESTDEKSVKK